MRTGRLLSFAILLLLVGCNSYALATDESNHPNNAFAFTPVLTQTPDLTETPVSSTTAAPSESSIPPLSTASTPGPCQSAMTQFEINDCMGKQAQETYSRLNSLIVDLKPHMDSSQYSLLLKIEAEWESVAKEHCNWEANFHSGGSIQPTIYAACLNQQYFDRIEALRLDLCEGSGMTGECAASLKYKE